jgi:hypothetical protein
MTDQRVESVASPRWWVEAPPKRSGVMYITRPRVVGGRGAEGAVCGDAVTSEGAVVGEGKVCKPRRRLSQRVQRQRSATSVGGRQQERATRVGGTQRGPEQRGVASRVHRHACYPCTCLAPSRQKAPGVECPRVPPTLADSPGPPTTRFTCALAPTRASRSIVATAKG